jgi:GNAT superfamily N-acetyltransferase
MSVPLRSTLMPPLHVRPMQIVPAKPDDAATLTAIAFAAKRHWGYPERWIESWHDLLTVSPEFIAKHETYAAIIDGRIAGFYALGRKGDRADLLHMWVLPDAMGRGVGRSLFLHAVERTKASGCAELEIESDPNAEGFYQRLGAHRIGSSICELEQQRRELPILVYKIGRVAGEPGQSSDGSQPTRSETNRTSPAADSRR